MLFWNVGLVNSSGHASSKSVRGFMEKEIGFLKSSAYTCSKSVRKIMRLGF